MLIRWPWNREQDLADYWDIHTRMTGQNHTVGEEALNHSNLINAKAAALISHVTLMAVTATFFLTYGNPSTSSQPIERSFYMKIADGFLIFELVAYLAITLLCLRSIWITRPENFIDLYQRP